MRFTFAATAAALAAPLVSAHYAFPYLVVGGVETGEWEYMRMTDNHYSTNPVTDVTSYEMKCYENSTASTTSTYTVAAGTTLGITATGPIYHPGYLDVYMSPAVPTAGTEGAGNGTTWFKIFEDAPVFVNATVGYVFPDETMTTVNFTIPKQLPSGDYLVRVEQIALHVASSFGGAQFYIACGQLTVTGGGNGVPGPLVAFPGAYTGNEPGILIDIYAPYPDGAYVNPGPAVWPGTQTVTTTSIGTTKTTTTSVKATTTTSTSTTSVKATTTTTTTSKATTTTSTAATSTATGGSALYGQCGGSGWAGPFTCAQGTCTYVNAYYSQCE